MDEGGGGGGGREEGGNYICLKKVNNRYLELDIRGSLFQCIMLKGE